MAGEVSRDAIDCVGDGVWDCLTRGSRKQILDSHTDIVLSAETCLVSNEDESSMANSNALGD